MVEYPDFEPLLLKVNSVSRQMLADSSPVLLLFCCSVSHNLVIAVCCHVFFLSCRTPVVLQDTLVLDLLYSEAGQSLLNILGTGVDTVDKLVSFGRYEQKMAFLPLILASHNTRVTQENIHLFDFVILHDTVRMYTAVHVSKAVV